MTAQVVILGAGRSRRGVGPSAITDTGRHQRVLDWLLAAFEALGPHDLCFVGGYRALDVVEQYPDLHVVVNRRWRETGPAGSFALAPITAGGDTYVCYADVVFRPAAVTALSAATGDAAVAVDAGWMTRYERRSASEIASAETLLIDEGTITAVLADSSVAGTDGAGSAGSAEFAGLLRLGVAAGGTVRDAVASGALAEGDGLPAVIALLLEAGHAVDAVDIGAGWAELDAPQDLARFVLGTKAESLERLRGLPHGGEIGRLVAPTRRAWARSPSDVLALIRAELDEDLLIVRSSARGEDGWLSSQAGRFETVPDVRRDDDAALRAAIDKVFASYDDDDPTDQVLVQAMLTGTTLSGVVMTRTPGSGAPYYVVDYDAVGGDTSAATAGRRVSTLYVHRGLEQGMLPTELEPVLATTQELEKLVGHDSLDIEFAVTSDAEVHVLQVRPIAVDHAAVPVDDARVSAAVARIGAAFDDLQGPIPGLSGTRTILSVMADWNPAEIIGAKPRRLARSLYEYLVTDEVWARQRAEYGYREVRPWPLLVDLAGHPYVDVRASLSSFVPAVLDPDLGDRLVDHQLDRLQEHPELHDKIEFEIALTCLAPDFHRRSLELIGAGFTTEEVGELERALRQLTTAGVRRLAVDRAAINQLSVRFAEVMDAGLPAVTRASLLLADCRRLGTPAFSHWARNGFVATIWLRALEQEGELSAAESREFLMSIETVAGGLAREAAEVAAGERTWEELVADYGHLRPGTYDITSRSYRELPEQYLRPMVDRPVDPARGGGLTPGARARLAAALDRHRLGVDVATFESFLTQSIAGREWAKFVFTRNLSAALDAMAEFGGSVGVDREALSHAELHDLLIHRNAPAAAVRALEASIAVGRESFEVTQAVSLPGFIAERRDVSCFMIEEAEPNFVTRERVEGEVMSATISPDQEFAGRVVLIPNADPGYDWLFSRRIAALVTMYGGANSHMAVRAAEMGLPAAIGVGELLYERLRRAHRIELDAGSRSIRVIR